MGNEMFLFQIYAKEIKRFKPVSAEELINLVAEYQKSQNPAVLQSIFEATSKLGSKIAHQFRYTGIPLEDLIQVANEAIILAVGKWSKKWVDIGTFFGGQIRFAIQSYISNHGFTVRFPSELTKYIKDQKTELELAEKTGQDAVLDDKYHVFHSCSVIGFAEAIGTKDLEDENDSHDDIWNTLLPLVTKLPRMQKQIVLLRFFKNYSMNKIATEFGITKAVVKEKLEQAMSNLKKKLTQPKAVRNVSGLLKSQGTRRTRTIGIKNTPEHNALASAVLSIVKRKGQASACYGSKWIHKDGQHKKLKGEELEQHLQSGWKLGRKGHFVGAVTKTKGTKWVSKDGKNIQVRAEEIESYLSQGWTKGMTQILNWVKRGEECKAIPPAELKDYLKAGWIKGRIFRNKPTGRPVKK